ncbi:MAG: tripartite tricarboxylate transporter TctB family protein [Pseudomonadota bacterium]
MSGETLRDVLVAALFGILALAALLFLIPTGVQAPSTVEQAALSPDFWPKVIAWTTLVAAGLLLVETLGAARMSAPGPTEDPETSYDHSFVVGLLRALALIVVLFIYSMTLERYGIVVPSIVLLPLIMLFFGERNPLTIGVLSLVLPLALYGFFRHAAGISIPLGVFG